jgi:thioredoxin-dependent peroxiredoxin
MLAEGTLAPDFTLPDQDGDPIRLGDLRGRWVVLWWYPKADTPGCTAEGCSIRDRMPDLEAAGATVLGVSFDTPEDNRAFAERYAFPFRLLSDRDRAVGEAYETKRAPEEPSPEWPKRRTYLIDPDGVIRKAYRVRDVTAHPGEVLADLRALREG